MASICNLGFSNFKILKFFGRRSDQNNWCASPYKFHQNQSYGSWDIAFTTVKMMAVCHFGIFFKFNFLNSCYRTKFQQNRQKGFGDITIFRFSRWPPSSYWILIFLNFWSTITLNGLICIAVLNFTKISQTVAEISHLTIFKMAAVCHLGFLKVYFFQQLISSGELICAIMQNFVEIGQMV